MALTKFEKDMAVIQKLADEPNDTDGLSSQQLKAKFDEGGEAVKEYINNTMLPELEKLGVENTILSVDLTRIRYIRVNDENAVQVSADNVKWQTIGWTDAGANYDKKADLVDGIVPAEQLPALESKNMSIGADTEKNMFGDSTGRKAEEMLNKLSTYSLHWWMRRTRKVALKTSDTEENVVISNTSGDSTAATVEYYTGVTPNGNTLEVSFTGEAASVSFTYADPTATAVLAGKYFKGRTGDTVYLGTGTYGKQHPADYQVYVGGKAMHIELTYGEWEYITSLDRNTYTEGVTDYIDGYEYVYMGVPFENAKRPSITKEDIMEFTVELAAEAVSLPMSGIDWSKYDKVVIDHVVSTDDTTLGTNWRINGSTNTDQGGVYYRYTSGDAYYQDGRITSTFVGAKRRRVIFNVYRDATTPIMLFHQYEHSFGFGSWPQKTYADFETLSISAGQSGKLVQPGSTFKIWGLKLW